MSKVLVVYGASDDLVELSVLDEESGSSVWDEEIPLPGSNVCMLRLVFPQVDAALGVSASFCSSKAFPEAAWVVGVSSAGVVGFPGDLRFGEAPGNREDDPALFITIPDEVSRFHVIQEDVDEDAFREVVRLERLS